MGLCSSQPVIEAEAAPACPAGPSNWVPADAITSENIHRQLLQGERSTSKHGYTPTGSAWPRDVVHEAQQQGAMLGSQPPLAGPNPGPRGPSVDSESIHRQLLEGERSASKHGYTSTGSARSSGPRLVLRVHEVQQQVAMLSSQPLLALSEAVELLVNEMEVDFAGVCVNSEDEPGCALLLAMHGGGATTLERHTVMRGPEWSAVRLAQEGAPPRIYVGDAAAPKHNMQLPLDFDLLHKEAGIRSFMTVAIGPRGHPCGALLLGRRQLHGFDDQWSSVWPTAVATGLLCHMRPAQVAQIVQQLKTVDQAQDPISAISAVLQSGVCFMLRTTNVRMGVRLALVEGEDADTALIFESESARATHAHAAGGLAAGASAGRGGSLSAASVCSANGKSVALPADPVADVTVRELRLTHTLLASALEGKKARFLKDCASYMQYCPAPAMDVFTHASQMVSSLVVVPLLVDDRALGALYFTQDTPCDFSNIQDALLGFVHCVTLTLHHKLSGQMDLLKGMVEQLDKAPLDNSAANELMQLTGSDTDDTAEEPDAPHTQSSAAAVSGGSCPANLCSARLSKVSSRQLCTEAMVKVLQQEIRKGRRSSAELSACDDLVIQHAIGRGGFGSVYKGTWNTIPAAIKVMNARSSNSEAVSDAMEMAVLSSVQHPNIVQVYACLTDMVAVDDCGFDSASSYPRSSGTRSVLGRPRFRRLMPGEQLDSPTFNIVVMEHMDRGTLHEAVRAGAFHQRMPTGDIGVDLAAVVDVLLAIAHSLQYLHSNSLLHGDVKLDNVLLKSDNGRPLGIAPKLSDFGLTKILKSTEEVFNFRGAGTVTHMPPELFQTGSLLTTGIDVYAFGIMMWELYTARRVWHGMSRDAIVDHVVRQAERPSFPAGAPAAYTALAAACWAQSPGDRLSFSEIVAELHGMSAAAHDEFAADDQAAVDLAMAELEAAAVAAMAAAQQPAPPSRWAVQQQQQDQQKQQKQQQQQQQAESLLQAAQAAQLLQHQQLLMLLEQQELMHQQQQQAVLDQIAQLTAAP